MGFFSGVRKCWNKTKEAVCDAGKAIYNGIKTVVTTVAEPVVEVAKAIGTGVTNMAKAFGEGVTNMAGSAGRFIKDKIIDPALDFLSEAIGKKKFEEAKNRYEKLTNKYNEKQAAYERQIGYFANEIKSLVESVNAEKQYIINTLFVKMKSVLSKIKYDNKYSLEYFKMPSTKVEPLRKREELFLIDFDKDPVKSYLKAFVSLGRWTKKQATETLDKIIEEEEKAENIVSEMDADLKRLELLKTALTQTLTYLRDMSAMYENVVYKANNTAKFLRFKCMQFTHGISMEYCKLEVLPKADRELMFALFNFTKILDDIVKMELVGQDTDEIKQYEMNLQKCQFEFNKARETIAA